MRSTSRLGAFLAAACLTLAAQADESVDHPAVQEAAQRLEWEAVELLKEDRVHAALPLLEKSAALWEVAAGTNTRQTYRALNSLQSAYFRVGRYAEMLAIMQRRLDIAREMFGESHDQVILCMRNVAVGLEAVGRHAEAQKMRDDAQRLRR